MKWTIHELIKKQNFNNEFSMTLDFSDKIIGTDILNISPVEVVGDFEIIDNRLFIFYIDIKCKLTLACALTLKEVEYNFDFSTEEIFSEEEIEDYNLIEGITIDLSPIIWQNILLEKPMRVLSENAYENFEVNNTEFDEDEDINQAFANLKNHKK